MPAPSAPAADWLTPREAIRRITGALSPLSAEEVPLATALGRVLAEEVASPVTLPPWDNSAMDGFAVRADDVRGASRERPVRLAVAGEVRAGGSPERPVGPGQAVKVMTGAPVPKGADSVIRIEDTDASRTEADRVAIYSDRDAGRHIRPRGEDVQAGQRVLAAGTMLSPGRIALLAAVGRAAVRVHRRPRVAVLSSGDELVDLDAFHEVVAGRRIVNSNGYGLAAAVLGAGAEPVNLGIARDDPADIRRRVRESIEGGADVLVTSAGASVGEHDLLKRALSALRFELEFWRVRIRPGSPFSYGSLPHPGRGRLPVFGLPGNPVSALVTFEIFVRPALRILAGHRRPFRPTVVATASERLPGGSGLTHFLRVHLERTADGWAARLTGPQGSGLVSSVAAADGLAVVPRELDEIVPGAPVTVILLDDAAVSTQDFPF